MSTLRLFKGKNQPYIKSNNAEAIVGEAKTSSREAIEQIKKYLGKKIFNRAYEIIPNKKEPEVICGLITFDDSGEIVVYEGKEKPVMDKKIKETYFKWLGNYIKYFLLANISNKELNDFYEQKLKQEFPGITESLISFVNNLTYEEIIEAIANFLKD